MFSKKNFFRYRYIQQIEYLQGPICSANRISSGTDMFSKQNIFRNRYVQQIEYLQEPICSANIISFGTDMFSKQNIFRNRYVQQIEYNIFRDKNMDKVSCFDRLSLKCLYLDDLQKQLYVNVKILSRIIERFGHFNTNSIFLNPRRF